MNWEQRIARAEKRGGFSPVDKRLANKWLNCAVGERATKRQWYASDPGWGPKSIVLEQAGTDFGYAVTSDALDDARDAYKRIDRWFARYGAKQ